MEELDIERFPLFVNAQPYHLILEPGDVLFIPPGWWHHVRSLDTCISVNYWWNRLDIVDGIGMEFIEVERLKEVVQSFLDNGLTIDHTLYEGENLLIKAVKKGHANALEALLQMGANPDSKSIKYNPGTSALTLAVEKEDPGMVRLLLDHGATDEEGAALSLANEKGNDALCELLKANVREA